ncbi:MAG: DUF2490 domain-containing protein [Flavobacteriales bacterium]|jgi:hypothetical protein
MKTSIFLLQTTLFCLLCCATTMRGQTVWGVFPTIDASIGLNEKNNIGLYHFAAVPLQSIQGDVGAGVLLYYAEQSFNHAFTDNTTLTGAYVYQAENPGTKGEVHEQRGHVQLKQSFNLGSNEVQLRLRSDNRFIRTSFSDKFQFQHRGRLLAGWSRTFNKWKIYAYEEAFFNTPSSASPYFAENWAALQFNRSISNRSSIEFGPLYITWKTGPSAWFHQLYGQFTYVVKLR